MNFRATKFRNPNQILEHGTEDKLFDRPTHAMQPIGSVMTERLYIDVKQDVKIKIKKANDYLPATCSFVWIRTLNCENGFNCKLRR